MRIAQVTAFFKKFQPETRVCVATPANALPILTATDLLAPPHRQGFLRQLSSLVSVSDAHFQALYVTPIKHLAELVQQLPASEAHHHVGQGGLLDHSMEVAVTALQLRRGYLLPPGAPPEDQARLQDLWTYAVFTSALMHDIGKPVMDQHVELYDEQGRSSGVWDPWGRPMPDPGSYRVRFARERRHKLHERVVPLLAPRIITPAGLGWLAGDHAVFAAWIAALSGVIEDAGALGEILLQADQQSVARNLTGAASVPRVATTQAKPLADRLLTGLRYLLDEGALPLNRPGAAGFCAGEDLWLVSKRALDALREHLLAEGQPGIPSRNERVMDELQQHGLLIPNQDRAIWTADVQLEDWSQRLTLLRFAASRLWPDPQTRPQPMTGRVTSLADQENPPAEAFSVTDLPLPVVEAEHAMAVTQLAGTEGEGGGGEGSDATRSQPPGQGASPQEATPAPNIADEEEEDPGARFLRWLAESIDNGSLEVNTPRARLHVLSEGLALVTPGIFRDFDPSRWQNVQKRFQRLKHHRKRSDGTNIWDCKVEKNRKKSLIRVILLPDPQAVLGVTLPPANPAVFLLAEEPLTSAE